jgi:predicted PurR-regulated permease PerM
MTLPVQPQVNQADDQPIAQRPQAEKPAWPATTPLGSWWRVVGAGAVALALGLGMLAAVWLLAQPLALLALGVALGEALAPLVTWLNRRVPRSVAILLVYLLVLLVLAGIFWIIIPPLIDQVQQANQRIPDLMNTIQNWLVSRHVQLQPGMLNALTSQLGQLSSALVSLPLGIFSSLLDVVLVFFVSLYWLFEVPSMGRFFLSLLPADRRDRASSVAREMGQAMGGFIRGAVLDGLFIGVLTYIGLAIIDVRYPLVLSMIAGLLEFVPFVGPIIAAVPILGMALLQSPTKLLIALIFVIALHATEGNIVAPNVMHSQTRISPLLVLLALVAGFTIGGILGALIAIPLSATIRVFVEDVVAPAVRSQTGAAACGTESAGGGAP